MEQPNFSELNLSSALDNALEDLGFDTPTRIQSQAFGPIMSGRDVMGIAQTGTGKTLAYLLPLLRLWKFSKGKSPTILVLVPTRELVVQVVQQAQDLAKYMSIDVKGVYGGTNIRTQAADLAQGAHLLVATPGRCLDLALNGAYKAKTIQKLVIDEVDEMFNLGFRTQLKNILDLLQPKRQNLLFSATMIEEVEELAKKFFDDPVKIEAAPTGTPLKEIDQKGFSVVNFNTKINLLKYLLLNELQDQKVLVFCATKKIADQIFEELEPQLEERLGVIHSNKAQNNRLRTVVDFEAGTDRILIATDLVARGLDISKVNHVINIDVPIVPENYVHRIGRTGRAKAHGVATTFVTEKEMDALHEIETLTGTILSLATVPEGVEISDVLTLDEMPKIVMPNADLKNPDKEERGPAFHEKKEKNKKVNVRYNHKEAMKKKYGKPQRRSDNKKR